MNKAILHTDVQTFIWEHRHTDVVRIGLARSPFSDVSSLELAQQIDSRSRCEVKLPLWYNTRGIYYPAKLAIEQCSSEATAKYKSLLALGNQVIDLTGGFGVDACFFSKTARFVTHCEIDQGLSDISRYNSAVLGFNVAHEHIDGIYYLNSVGENYDTIYIDPSRRIGSRKVFLLKDCEPDVIREGNLLKEAARVIIKTAPLLDLQSTVKELGAVSQIHILSVKNECKEVLYLIDKNMSDTDPRITCAVLSEDQPLTFTFRASEEKTFKLEGYSKPLNYLYEPDVSLLKAGCFKLITREFKVEKIHQNTHLYTSDMLQLNFMGRKFRVLNTNDYGSFMKRRHFTKANIICRNFPLDPEKIRKKLKINDGGDDYLIFCTGPDNELSVVHCLRIF